MTRFSSIPRLRRWWKSPVTGIAVLAAMAISTAVVAVHEVRKAGDPWPALGALCALCGAAVCSLLIQEDRRKQRTTKSISGYKGALIGGSVFVATLLEAGPLGVQGVVVATCSGFLTVFVGYVFRKYALGRRATRAVRVDSGSPGL